jgi:phage shock protein PspC (stress-responsive transcriptional regulator)
MQKVIAINLNGHAYQLDEPAYDLLRAYLDRAEVQLKDNPDREEIIADLEQAIADKCNRFLGPHKTVVTAFEIEQVVRDMGPVEGPEGAAGRPPESNTAGHGGAGSRAGARKRLYQISEGAMFSGVCNGLAAYFDVDVTIVRIIFVALTVVTKGAWILAYLVLAFVIPHAETSEEHAAAHGLPFSAQELIDQAKTKYSDFKEGKRWRQQWRRQHREWREKRRQWRAAWRQAARDHQWGWWGTPPRQSFTYAGQVWAGFMVPFFSLVSAAFFVALTLSVISLIRTGGLLGWPLPSGIPLWAGILILVVLYQVLVTPIRAGRQASLYAFGPGHFGLATFWDGFVWLGLLTAFGWLLYTRMPEVHTVREFIDHVPEALKSLVG